MPLIRDKFHTFIDAKLTKRKKKLIKNENLRIKAKPEIVEIFIIDLKSCKNEKNVSIYY